MRYPYSMIFCRFFLIMLIVSVIACGMDNSVPQTSSALSEKLLEISKKGPQGAQQRLEEVTDFNWDTVYYFEKGVLKTEVNETSDATVFKRDSGRYYGHGVLLVFKYAREMVGVYAIVPPLFITGTSQKGYSIKDATVVAHSKDPGPYSLRLVDQ